MLELEKCNKRKHYHISIQGGVVGIVNVVGGVDWRHLIWHSGYLAWTRHVVDVFLLSLVKHRCCIMQLRLY